MPWDKQKEE
jgi:hypothetical protein